MSNLVATEWLATRLGDPNLVIIDASWHLPTSRRMAREEYLAGHIPGAQFYDLDAGAAQDTSLPHMLPDEGKFAADMSTLGVSNGHIVVCYDTVGLFSAARLWWMLKTFGHDQAYVLNGGLFKWKAESRPLENGPPKARIGAFAANLKSTKVATLSVVADALREHTAQIADARSPSRFRGDEPEPRQGVKPGHMPGAHNLHYAALLNADGTLKSNSALLDIFQSSGIDLSKPIITSCGSGVTAAILTLALSELGINNSRLYDGSWAEWGSSPQKIVTGSD